MERREKEIYKITAAGSGVNVGLTVLKFIGGIVGKSSAMVADAVHSLSDLITDAIIFIFVKTASKPSDKTHEYGHGKFETLATFLVGLILIVVGIGILYNGVRDCIKCLEGHPQPSPTWLALAVALISIISKEWLYHATLHVGKKWESEVVIANAWHHRSDSISSLATLIGIAGAMFLGEKWRILDPLAASLVSFFIMKVGLDTIRPSVDELLERALPPEIETKITDTVKSINGVEGLNNLRTRRIGQGIAIEIDVKLDGAMSLREADKISDMIEGRLKREFGKNTHVGIHLKC